MLKFVSSVVVSLSKDDKVYIEFEENSSIIDFMGFKLLSNHRDIQREYRNEAFSYKKTKQENPRTFHPNIQEKDEE